MTPFQAMRMRKPVVAGGADPYFSSTKLLLGGEGANNSTTFTDESAAARGNATVVSGAKVSTAQSKFGTGSILLNGSSDYLTYPDSTDWEFGSGQFTVECWVRFNTVGSNRFVISHVSSGNTGWYLARNLNSNFQFYASGGSGLAGVTWSASTGVWYHLAADRDGSGVTRSYIDGVMQEKFTNTNAIDDPSITLAIGTHSGIAGSRLFDGWIDEVRITKGVARYASDSGYTVPTAAFPRS